MSSNPKIDDIPVGGVIPFAGGNDTYPPNFPSYIRYDGTVVQSALVPTLATTVGTKFQSGKTTGTFTTPNLAGKFIRGVDPTAVNDPDAGKRQPAPDGSATGLGTWQYCATRFNNASVNVSPLSTFSRPCSEAAGNLNIEDVAYVSEQTWRGGDAETRPINAALHFYINSIDPGASQIFPIGGIIAIPGVPKGISGKTWLLCNGAEVPKGVYGELFRAIGTTWGAARDPAFLKISSLNGYFLRGADMQSAPNGDPDRDCRLAFDSTGKALSAGSYQDGATAQPTTNKVGSRRQLSQGRYMQCYDSRRRRYCCRQWCPAIQPRE